MGYLARLGLMIGAAALFAGCGGSQSPIGAPLTIARSRAIATYADRNGSWNDGNTSYGDLLYVSNAGNVFAFTYPGGEQILQFNGQIDGRGLCSDANGNVFIAYEYGSTLSSTIYEYAHGGTTPIAALSDPGRAFGCAVDPSSGDLAVTNYRDYNQRFDAGDVAVYASAKGAPRIYFTDKFNAYSYCSYDNA